MGAPAVRGALARRFAPVRGHRRETGGASPARQGWQGVPRQGGLQASAPPPLRGYPRAWRRRKPSRRPRNGARRNEGLPTLEGSREAAVAVGERRHEVERGRACHPSLGAAAGEPRSGER